MGLNYGMGSLEQRMWVFVIRILLTVRRYKEQRSGCLTPQNVKVLPPKSGIFSDSAGPRHNTTDLGRWVQI